MRLTAAAAITKADGKVYRLKRGLPPTVRGKGRAILVSISRHRGATANTIRRDMPRNFQRRHAAVLPCGKVQRDNVVIA
jgi:hypothetical protein